MNNKIRPAQTRTITPEGMQERTDVLVNEEPLEIRLAYGSGQGRKRLPVAVTMRTPGDDEDLAVGFLFTEGIIAHADKILSVRMADENVVLIELAPEVYVDEERLLRHFYTTSSCGLCGKASLEAVQTLSMYRSREQYPLLSAERVYEMPETLRQAQKTFDSTGGLHASGLFTPEGDMVLLREDIGRHNAVDKVIGAALRMGAPLPFSDYTMLVSGRAGFELVQKSSMAGIPVLAAVGAPSSLSVELAEDCGMTLIGFLRDKRFNVYTGAERIPLSGRQS